MGNFLWKCIKVKFAILSIYCDGISSIVSVWVIFDRGQQRFLLITGHFLKDQSCTVQKIEALLRSWWLLAFVVKLFEYHDDSFWSEAVLNISTLLIA